MRFEDEAQTNGVRRRHMLRSAALLAPAALAGPALGGGVAAAAEGGADTAAALKPRPTRLGHWNTVATAFGRPGSMIRDAYYHTRFPRSDLFVVSEGVHVAPGLALGSHASFAAYEDGSTLAMGDFVVPETALQQFVDDIHATGLTITALHKHLLAHEPALWWMHACGATREPEALAAGLRLAFERSGSPAYDPTAYQPPSRLSELDTAGIDAALHAKGTANGDVYAVAFTRRERVVDDGRLLPAGLGATTALNFQPLGAGRAAISGDFAMVAAEVPAALAALRRGGLQLVSLHNHNLADRPRLLFTHFWAVDDAVRIAEAVHAAIVLTQVRPAVLKA